VFKNGIGVLTEFAERKGQSRFDGRLGKVLTLDLEASDLDYIVIDKALERAGPVLDLELGPVRLVRRRGGRVVLGLRRAGAGRAGAHGHFCGPVKTEKARATYVEEASDRSAGLAGNYRSFKTKSVLVSLALVILRIAKTHPRGWTIPCRDWRENSEIGDV
jgi:hypothetical protein